MLLAVILPFSKATVNTGLFDNCQLLCAFRKSDTMQSSNHMVAYSPSQFDFGISILVLQITISSDTRCALIRSVRNDSKVYLIVQDGKLYAEHGLIPLLPYQIFL